MSDNLPGVPLEEQENALTPQEIARQERMALALNTYRATGSYRAVSKALGLVTTNGDKVAKVWVNRALEQWGSDGEKERLAVMDLMNATFTEVLATLGEEFRAGARDRINEMVRVADRLAKLHGTDAREEINLNVGPQVIDARLPWERQADVESTAEPVGELEAGE